VEWVRGDRWCWSETTNTTRGKRSGEDRDSHDREDSSRVLGLEAGDYDLIVRIRRKRCRADARGRVRIYAEQSNRAIRIAFNMSKKPLDDLRVRQALNYAIDKDSIVKNIYQAWRLSSRPW